MGAQNVKDAIKKIDQANKIAKTGVDIKGVFGKPAEWLREKRRNDKIGRNTCIDIGEDWTKTGAWLASMVEFPKDETLEYFGMLGVQQLYEYTPKRTGKTAESWSYEIEKKPGSITLYWNNSNLVWQDNEKVSVAVLIQNGHATPKGNWVEGRDYITPALEPVIKKLNEVLSEEARGK